MGRLAWVFPSLSRAPFFLAAIVVVIVVVVVVVRVINTFFVDVVRRGS